MSARAPRCSLKMPDIRLQPIPVLTGLRRFSCFAGGVHVRKVRDPRHHFSNRVREGVVLFAFNYARCLECSIKRESSTGQTVPIGRGLEFMAELLSAAKLTGTKQESAFNLFLFMVSGAVCD